MHQLKPGDSTRDSSGLDPQISWQGGFPENDGGRCPTLEAMRPDAKGIKKNGQGPEKTGGQVVKGSYRNNVVNTLTCQYQSFIHGPWYHDLCFLMVYNDL